MCNVLNIHSHVIISFNLIVLQMNVNLIRIFIPRHTIVAGYYGFTLDVRVSVRPSVFRFRMIT